MTLREVPGQELADALNGALPGTVQGFDEEVVWVQPSRVHAVAEYLRDDPSHDFQFLNSISAVDYVEYFDLVYHLTSLRQLSTAVFKARVYGRDELKCTVGVPGLARRGLPGTGDMGPDGHSLYRPPQYEADHALGGL